MQTTGTSVGGNMGGAGAGSGSSVGGGTRQQRGGRAQSSTGVRGSRTLQTTGGRSTMRSNSRGGTRVRRIDPETGQVVESFTGPTQPTVSRADTKVWLLTKRPGPGEYRTLSSIGKQVDGRKVTAPKCKFGKSERYNFHNSVWRLTPSQGPKYRLESSFGRQKHSMRHTAPAHGFGTSTRDSALKQYGVWSV